MSDRTCLGCSNVFTPSPRERNPRKYCSGACAARVRRLANPEAERQRVLRALAKRAAKSAAARPGCGNCGRTVRRLTAAYCSAPECARISRAVRMRSAYAANPEAMRRRSSAQRDARTPEQYQAELDRMRGLNQAAGYTSARREADARRRALLEGSTAEKFDRREVFERDGWKCGICRRTIDKNLIYPDPKSVSLDHVVPVSEGGDHTRANTRATHLDCNIRRNVGRNETAQLSLI